MLKTKVVPKVIAFLLLICFGISMVTGWISYQNGKRALKAASFNQLTALREIKSNQLNSYLALIEGQIQTLSQSPMTIEAMREYKSSFSALATAQPMPKITADEPLYRYYQTEFLPKLEQRSHETYALDRFLPTSEAAIYLQHHYIALNTEPNAKDEMSNAGDGSKYSHVHEKYHPTFRNYRDKFGYHDIFLVDDETGEIMYSVLKEIDYATSLLTGSLRRSGIAETFKKAREVTDSQGVEFTDFNYYEPSYGAPAAFVGSPIYDGKQRLGVLIFQLPIQQINDIMTGGENWSNDGLGQSGETYLVGPDGRMRSMSRFLIEDRTGYFAELRSLSYPEKTLQKLDKYNTSVLLQNVQTLAAKRAMLGETGTAVIDDYRGVSVLSSYAPLEVGGMRWALIAEIDTAEAFAPIVKLSRDLAISATLIGFGVGLIAVLVAGRFIAPIKVLASAAEEVSTGNTSIVLAVNSEDEIGQLTQNFNHMVLSLHEQREEIEQQITENTKLLLNVLPAPIAERLKNGEVRIADAHPDASIMFTDLVGFTAWSKGKPAIEVLTLLDQLVRAFDEKAKALGIEKIKTIGDAYMAVCGLPTPNANHAQLMAELALYILDMLKDFNRQNGTDFKMRIGLHCGPVVAGVIGTSKFIYDLWGESVNMASRMESTGIPDQIQVSESFYQAIKGQYIAEMRGEIVVKGAGSLNTYLLRGRL